MFQNDCIFCKIVAGDIPAHKVYEDEHCLAFLDIHPLARGHVLLIPKAHVRTMDELSPMQAGHVLSNLPGLVKSVSRAVEAEGVNILQNNGKAAHQEIMHVHVHIIPRTSGDAWQFNWPAMESAYSQDQAEELARKIREGQ